jgi:4-amino-4-deoxy-L-arabinose transferase-like glycosyltransferase
MKKKHAFALLLLILLAAFFLRQYRLFGLPFFGDEVFSGDIALDILHGKIAPFYPQAKGREGLYFYSMAIAFAVLGDSEIANRWPSVAWSMLFVALMYVYGQRLFNGRRVGVMTAGLTAALWWPAVFAHVGLRAGTMPVVMTPALLGLVLGLRVASERRALTLCVVGGFFAGLTAYTYTAGRGFPAVVVLFLAYAALAHRKTLLKRWRMFLLYVILMIAVSIWLYVYLSMHPEYDVRVGTAQLGMDLIAKGDYKAFLAQVTDTVGMFTGKGEPNWLWNISGRPVFVGPEGWLFYLGLLLCVWRIRKPEYALQLIVIAMMLVPSILTEHPPSWTRSIGMLPALLVTAVLPVEWTWSKLESWVKKEPMGTLFDMLRRHITLPVYTVLVVVLGLSIYWRTAFDMFNVWMDNPAVYWMSYAFYDETADYITHSPDSTPLDFNMAWYVPWRRTNLKRPIQRKDVAVRWTVNNAFVFPDDPRGLRVAFQVLAAPAFALLDTFLDLDAPIYIDPRVDPQGRRPLRIYEIPRAELDEHLARAASGATFYPDTNAPIDSPVRVGDWLRFLGYEIVNPSAKPGDSLLVFTYWRVLQRPPDMAVFVHLLDPNGQVIAQYDGFDVVVDDLAPNDTVVQLHTLQLPNDLPDAEYRFELGAYTRDDSKRIPLSVGADHLWLQSWPSMRNR